MTTATDDQIEAALSDARRYMAAALGLGPDHRPGGGTSTFFDELWATVEHAPRCRHLDAIPIQPWSMTLPDRTWRCRPCARVVALDRLEHPVYWGHIEEHSCDRCRRYVPARNGRSALEPTIIRQDLWIILASLCSDCGQTLLNQGGRRLDFPAKPGRNDRCPCGSGRKFKRCCLDRKARP